MACIMRCSGLGFASVSRAFCKDNFFHNNSLVGSVPTLLRLQTTNLRSFSNRHLTTRHCLRNYELLKVTKKWVAPIRGTVTVQATASSHLPPLANKMIGWWLLGCSGMVFGAVVLGGVTRLTRSGLSMVDWHLFKEMPPLSRTAWEAEFRKYQEFPEFSVRNKDMTLEEFRWIWYMEYLHRMWGRSIAAAVAIPAGYFWYKGWFNKGMKIRTLVFSALLTCQGLLGWYMVKSGLERNPESQREGHVSQYRLAAHLGSAFVLYTLLLWSGLSHLVPPQQMPLVPKLRKFRMYSHMTKGLIFFTALSGAFVAGIEAGLVYNSFPKMADKWIPDDIMAYEPKRVNFTENPTTVQFDHRILGTSVLCAVGGLWFYSRRLPLSRRARLAVNCMMLAGMTQVGLGISTLLLYVPTALAALHQSGSLVLLSAAIWLSHELKLLKKIPKV